MGDRRFMGQGQRRRMGAPMSTLAMAENDSDDGNDGTEQCQTCGGTVAPMGSLGKAQWGRCRNCGSDQRMNQSGNGGY